MISGPGTGAAHAGTLRAAIPRLADWLPLALVVVAEAAWISVVGGLLQEFAHREPSLGLPALAVIVLVGALLARLVGRRVGPWWPITALVLVAAAAAVGGFAAPAARDAVAHGLGPAIAANPGGWMAGLALFRGFAHVRMPPAEGTVERLLGLGVPGIAGLAIVGGVIADPFRARFLSDTLEAAVVFAAAGILALTLARVSSIARGSAFDWRRNPAWLGLAVGVLVLAVAAAVPLSAVAGRAIEALIAIALGPLVLLGMTMGLDRTARRLVAFVITFGIVVYVLVRLFGTTGVTPAAPSSGVTAPTPTTADDAMTVGLAGVLLLVTVVAILFLTALWMRRVRPPEDDLVEETRRIDRGTDGPPSRRPRRRLGRRADPATAPQAYVALVEDLATLPAVRRRDHETPAEHAARLRTEGRTELPLDLLAADYALARYGGRSLSMREDRRAVGRWRLLRRRLTRPQA